MADGDRKDPAPSKVAPAEKGWSFALALTKTEGDGTGETALSWRQRLSPLDVALVAAGLVLFLVEPFAVYMFLSHYKGPLLAAKCAPSSHVVVVHQPQEGGPPEHAAGSAPGFEEGGQGDVITPLNVRDPSMLVMTPYVYRPPREEPADAQWREVVSAAAKGSEGAASLPKPAKEGGP